MNIQSKRIKRIIYLSRQGLNIRNVERFGIELFQKLGYSVEYWDVTPVLHPDVYKEYYLSVNFHYPGLKVFHNKEELCHQLEILNDDTLVIDLIDFNYLFLKIYRSLSRSKADYTVNMANALPYEYKNKYTFNQFYQNILNKSKKLLKPSAWLNKVLQKLPFQWLGIRPARFLMAGGKRSIKMYKFPVDRNTEIVWAHSFDYDLYLKEKCNSDCTVTPTAVFLDQFVPLHEDCLYEETAENIKPENYFRLINRFFDMVEKELKLEVVIAAHPRSDYENRKNYFEGRRCIRGETIRLVRESKLVLLHNSAAISFANLFNKPMTFMIFDGLIDSLIAKTMAEWHGKQYIFIDRAINIDWKQELNVNQECYQYYREQFIKTKGSAELPFWQILADRLP